MNHLKRILAIHSAGGKAQQPLQRAVQLAQKNGAALTVAMTVKYPSDSAGEIEQLRKKLGVQMVAAGATEIDTRSIVLVGVPFLEIIREVLRERYDLVIIGAEQQRSLKSLFLGSTVFHLLRKCPCPVLVTHAVDKPSYARIVAALDPNPDSPEAIELSQGILDLATSFATWNHAELHLAHAWDVDHGEKELLQCGLTNELKRRILDKAKGRAKKRMLSVLSRHDFAGLKYRMHLPRGEPGIAISKLVEKRRFDLIVLGTVCRTGIPGFFIGNTAEFLLHAVDCAILAVKPRGFVTPVTLQSR